MIRWKEPSAVSRGCTQKEVTISPASDLLSYKPLRFWVCRAMERQKMAQGGEGELVKLLINFYAANESSCALSYRQRAAIGYLSTKRQDQHHSSARLRLDPRERIE